MSNWARWSLVLIRYAPTQSFSLTNESENLRSAVEFVFDEAAFVGLVGIKLVEVERGKCVSRLVIEDKHLQHLGRVHGAALAALAGQTALGAAVSVVSQDEFVVCPDFKVSLLRGVNEGTLLSSARVIRAGKLLVFVEADIVAQNPDSKEPVLKASYTFTRLPKREDA